MRGLARMLTQEADVALLEKAVLKRKPQCSEIRNAPMQMDHIGLTLQKKGQQSHADNFE